MEEKRRNPMADTITQLLPILFMLLFVSILNIFSTLPVQAF